MKSTGKKRGWGEVMNGAVVAVFGRVFRVFVFEAWFIQELFRDGKYDNGEDSRESRGA